MRVSPRHYSLFLLSKLLFLSLLSRSIPQFYSMSIFFFFFILIHILKLTDYIKHSRDDSGHIKVSLLHEKPEYKEYIKPTNERSELSGGDKFQKYNTYKSKHDYVYE